MIAMTAFQQILVRDGVRFIMASQPGSDARLIAESMEKQPPDFKLAYSPRIVLSVG